MEHSSQFPSPSMSFSSKAWKGIRAGLCRHKKVEPNLNPFLRARCQFLDDHLTIDNNSPSFFSFKTWWTEQFAIIRSFMLSWGIIQALTCEEVITVMPMLVASLYRCSSTSTLVALQSRINFRTHSNWSANRNKNKWKKQKLHCDRIHTWCTRRGYQT